MKNYTVRNIQTAYHNVFTVYLMVLAVLLTVSLPRLSHAGPLTSPPV